MLKPLALALLVATGASLGGCGERRPDRPPAKTEGPPAAAERACPVEGLPPDKGSVCIAKTGPNWTYAFAYPAEAARIPALDAWLRSESKGDEGDHEDSIGSLAAWAKQNPSGQFHLERVYTLDSEIPALLALSKTTSSYTGGAHGWFPSRRCFGTSPATALWNPKSCSATPRRPIGRSETSFALP
jgi:hypothetical protein